MKTVIIVSKCLRVTKFNLHESTCEFHFKGVCAGEAIRKVKLQARHEFAIKKDQEYLMYVQLHSVEKGTLNGRILKTRLLDDCWDLS